MINTVLKHNFILNNFHDLIFVPGSDQWVIAHWLGTSVLECSISKHEMHCSVSKNSWGNISHFEKQKVFHYGQLKSDIVPLCKSVVTLL